MTPPEIKVLPDPEAVAREGAQRFVQLSEAAIEVRGRFSVSLSGGSTPKLMYQMLASPAFQPQVDWPSIDVFFGDERCVPPDHPDSNYRMAREALLSRVPLPGDNIYRMRGEVDPETAAKEYGQILKEKFGDRGLDLIYLGMGPDGHTASLFPYTKALEETKHRCVANSVPQLQTTRLTLTAPFINRAENVIILVTGREKAKTLAEVLEGPRDPKRLPVQLIQPASGKLAWVIDTAAASMRGED